MWVCSHTLCPVWDRKDINFLPSYYACWCGEVVQLVLWNEVEI